MGMHALRAAPSQFLRQPRASRTLVSSVLLARSYDTETVAQLKAEARRRTLTQSGSKAALVSRLLEDDRRTARPSAAPSASRPASTTAIPSGAPSPLQAQTLNIQIPDLIPPEPLQIQIPFVPDLWHSSKVIAETEEFAEPALPPAVPKLNVVDGSDNHPAEGVSHNVYHNAPARSSSSTADTSSSAKTTLWADVVEDLGLPKSFGRSVVVAEQTIVDALPEVDLTGGMKTGNARPLTDEEKRGVWIVLGALTGSWVLSGIFGS